MMLSTMLAVVFLAKFVATDGFDAQSLMAAIAFSIIAAVIAVVKSMRLK